MNKKLLQHLCVLFSIQIGPKPFHEANCMACTVRCSTVWNRMQRTVPRAASRGTGTGGKGGGSAAKNFCIPSLKPGMTILICLLNAPSVRYIALNRPLYFKDGHPRKFLENLRLDSGRCTFDPVDHVVGFNLSLDHNQGDSEFTLLGYFQATFQ